MWKHFASGAPAAFVVLLSSVGRQQPANLPSTVTTVGPGSCVADCHCPPVITCTAELVALSSAESAGQFWFNCVLVACVLNLFCLAVGKWAYPFTVAGIGASWSVSLPGLPPAVSAASSVDLLDFDSAVVASPLALELPARVKFAAAAKAVGYYAVVTPDGDMYIEPLNHVHNDVADIRVLQQQGHLPPGLLEADMYRFGAAPVGAVLAQFMRDGAFLAAGHAGPPAAAAAVPPPGGPGPVAAGGIVPAVPMFWVAAENLLGLRVGDSVEPLPAGTFTVGNKGILARGGGHLFIKAVPAGHVEAPEDLRVLPVVFDNQDLRFRDFGGALAAMDTAEPEGGIMLSGPRTCMWMLKNMRDSGGNPSSHHDRWVRSSKVADSDRSVYEHEILCRILESMICADQLNVPALQSAEILSRRIQLIKEAHRVNPSAPDYSAGDHFLGAGVRRNGAAIAPDLSKFVAEELRAEAAISKEARKAREEKGIKPRGGRGGRGGRLGKGGAAADAAGFRSEGMKRRAGRRTPSSSQMYSPREAIRELLGSSYGYSEVSTTVRPFDPALVSIPSVGTRAPSIMSVLDPVGVDVVADYEHSMLLSSNEYGSVLEEGIKVQPYMDVILQSSISSYQAFVHSLFTRGMLDFCEHAGGLVTPFFVIKKGGKLRLIFDCRTVNLRFKKAPKIAMGSGSSWASLEVAEGEQLWIAQSDIKDYFYSLALPAALAQFFCLPSIDASLLTEWGVPGALGGFSNYQRRCYPRLRVVPMGWSWAMWIAQRAHQFQALIGAGLNQDRLLVDGRPAPNLKDGTPIILPYCDNLNIAGTNRELVQQAKEGAVKRLREVGFLVHEEVEACLQVDSLGYTINGSTGIVAPQPLKAERLVKGFIYISRRPIMTGRQLEHVMGHCIHQMLLKRELLCIFRAFYDFISQCYDTPVVVWPSVVKEARWAATLLRLCHSNLRRPWDLLVTASDASLTGIAVTSARWELPDVVAVGAMNERWRYRGKHPSDKPRQSALGLLDPLLDVESVKPEADIQHDNYELNPNFKEVPERLLLPEDWKLRYSARVHDKENIMILEGRGVEASLRHRLRAQLSFGKRCLNLGDNLGLTLGFCKGRFTSYPLLRIARRVTALTVAGDLSPAHRWHPSERNTADAGSRKWEPPGPQASHEGCQEEEPKAALFSIPEGEGGKSEQEAASWKKWCERQSWHGNFAGGVSRDAVHQPGLRPEIGRVHNLHLRTWTQLEEPAEYRRCYGGLPSSVVGGRQRAARRTQVLCSLRGQTPRIRPFWSSAVAQDKEGAHRLEETGPVYDSAADALGGGLPDCKPHDPARLCHLSLDFGSAVHPVWQTDRDPRAEAEGPDQAKVRRRVLHRASSSRGSFDSVQGGALRRKPDARQSSLQVAGAAVNEASSSSRLPRAPLSNRIPHVETALGCRNNGGRPSGAGVCALSAATRRTQPRSLLQTEVNARDQTEGAMGLRCDAQALRSRGQNRARTSKARVGEAKSSQAGGPDLGSQAVSGVQSQPNCKAEAVWSFKAAERLASEGGCPGWRRTRGVFLELFSGSGHLAKAVAEAGLDAEGWDIDNGEQFDMLLSVNVSRLKSLLRSGFIKFLWMGMPCSSWSRARRNNNKGPGPLRDDGLFLWGLPNLKAHDIRKIAVGNKLLKLCVELALVCDSLGIPWCIENPETSRAWLTDPMIQLAATSQQAVFDFCAYGTPWRKRTRLVYKGIELNFKSCCSCAGKCQFTKQPHMQLSGTNDAGIFWTLIAQPYPKLLCAKLAQVIVAA
ncbi:unnamed protein product [Polarella glacialis]|uniref:Uncharacterized protein n=1 Tax=Polarella glacialis TaxID=89957 RepID=A0A813H9Q7_POLGL|nr:unnamed protein product [Polarella glacialis]